MSTSPDEPTAGRAPAPGGGRPDLDDISVVLLPAPAGPRHLDGEDQEAPEGETLRAVAGQRRRAQRVLVLHPEPTGEDADRLRRLADDLGLPVTILEHEGLDRSTAVATALDALPDHQGQWIWFLSTDARPEPGALAALGAAARRSSRVGVVGPKLVREDQPRLLRSLGHHLTPAGRVVDPTRAALVDQGQLDLRQDVLGVPLSGSLVRAAVLEQVGGIDPAFGQDGVDGLDLGWRSHLAGHRTVVAPDAVVRQGEAGLGVEDPLRTRVRVRQLALARGSLWAAPWRALGVLVTSLAAALVLLLVKRPAEAAGEWADVRAVLRPGRGLAARRRFRGHGSVAPRDLAGLHEPPGTGWRATLDIVGEALDPRSRRSRGAAGSPGGALGSGPVSEDFDDLAGEGRRSRWWSWPLALAVLVTAALTAWAGRGLWPGLDPAGAGLTGGELGVVATDAQGLWASAVEGWRGAGLGHDDPAAPWLAPLAAWSALLGALPAAGRTVAGPALAWLLALAPALSVASAYLALRRSTRRRWVRAALGLGWGVSAPLVVALGEGRVGPAVVHVLAPLLVAGLAVVAHRAGGVRRAAATFATVLGLALAAQWVPMVLLLGSVVGLVLLVLGRGSARWRGAVIALLPWLLVLAWWPWLVAGPVQLLGGAGATSAVPSLPSASTWQLLLLHPTGVDPGGSGALPLWLAVPWWLAALAALLLPGGDGRRAGGLLALAVGALGLAQVAVRTSLGALPAGHSEAGLVVTSWPGTWLSVAGAALLLAAGLTVDALLRTSGPASRRVPAGLAAALVLVAPLVAAGWTTWAPQARPALELAQDPVPAVAAEQARGPAAVRTLLLRPQGDALLVDLQGAEPEPSRVLRDRTAELAAGVPVPGPVEQTVAALVGGASADDAAQSLLDLGVGYVLLEADDAHPAADDLDRVSGLIRVSSPEGSVLWRMVDGEPARTTVVAADGSTVQVLPATGPHGAASGTVEVPPGAALRVSEGPGWGEHARVRVDGEVLEVGSADQVALPEGRHLVEVDLPTPGLPWQLLTLALAAVVAFLALPVGRTERGPQEVP
ncbi:glycosyltransferase [Serinicoccus kebangsaanensis]|uniref:glycosyltransferase n=1 Tax=Serinicoccus kebangsaanensis TaxID=2602069 RepID=UPI00124E9679|nr:glycosyltransferase [Serinicoccus kebangsaanensis]